MATIYKNPSLAVPDGIPPARGESYSTYQEPDTRVPPKAGPVIPRVSVNGIPVAERDILAEAQNHPAKNPGAALREAAEALVIQELLWQEASRLGIAGKPGAGQDGKIETERDAAIRALVEDQVAAPSASEEESRRYYDRHPDKFRSEPLFEARHILIAAPESDAAARAAARELATSLCARLSEAPEAFASAAMEYSDCSSREHGGNLGQLSRGSTVAEFEKAMLTMEAGKISATPVESRFGFHVIALDRKIPGERLPFEFVGARIAAWLEASSWSKAVSQYIGVLAGQAKLEGISLGQANGPLVQ
jgi:peptidyl-prolyl cis-trans isomerase C